MNFENLIHAFGVEGDFLGYEELFVGNINQTYKLRFSNRGEKEEYVFQRLNTYVFKQPREVMSNIQRVTEHMRKALGANSDRRVLHFLTAASGEPYVENGDGFWRAYHYIDRARTYDMVPDPQHFEKAGFAFGQFQRALADFPADTLNETIARFHDTPDRMRQLHEAIQQDVAGRATQVEPEIRFILDRENEAGAIVEALESGKIPWRTTHNDTKINNVLFDLESDEPICVIDLDTIMPGSSLYDFGDAIRSGANTAGEDEADLSLVHFDLEMFERFTAGFLAATGDRLTDDEIALLPQSVLILTLELCARFLTDYLNGDVYFKVKKPEHNLIRTRNQIELARQMEEKLSEMAEIVKKHRNHN